MLKIESHSRNEKTFLVLNIPNISNILDEENASENGVNLGFRIVYLRTILSQILHSEIKKLKRK